MTMLIVPGEEELGPQRVCPRCRSAWPLDSEFWSRTTKRGRECWASWCKACVADHSRLRRASPARREMVTV